MSGSSWVALPDVRECSGDPLGCLEVVGSPSRMSGRPSCMSGRGQEALPYVREWLRRPPGYPGVFGRNSRMSGNCREALSYVW